VFGFFARLTKLESSPRRAILLDAGTPQMFSTLSMVVTFKSVTFGGAAAADAKPPKTTIRRGRIWSVVSFDLYVVVPPTLNMLT
jgi:hypothetical protein